MAETAETIIDIIDGGGRKTYEKGWELERIAIVKGIPGSGVEKILNAVTASGIVLGQAHPALSTCLLYDISPTIIDSDTVKLRLSYSESYLRGFNTAEIGATVQQVETNMDAGGYSMYASYPAHSNQGHLVSKFVPEMTISITRFETGNPQWKAANFVGLVNIGPWSLDPYAPARTWLCTGIIGHSPDHGTTWWVTYTFVRRPENFDAKLVWLNDGSIGNLPIGSPPANATPIYWQIYTMTDFDALGLS